MIVTVFRSRLMPGVREEYIALVDRMVELAATMPGYISHKGFFAEDGERVTVVEFEHEEGMRAWRTNPEHRAAQKKAREIYYSEYRQWAEHLDKGIQRVLASDLSALLPSARVITSAWQSGDVKSEVHVSIQRFELDESGEATLECEWRILSPENGRVQRLDHSLISKKGSPLATNPTGAVSTLSQLLGELSNQIAAAVKTSG